jgi:hypothetical protein
MTDHPNVTFAPHGRTHIAMTISTCTATASPDVVRTALITDATFLRCSIGCQPSEFRAGLGSHPLGNAAGSRDAS